MFGEKRVAQSGSCHGQDPIVTVATIDRISDEPLRAKDLPYLRVILTVDAEQIRHPYKVGDTHRLTAGEPVVMMDPDHELLAKQREIMEKRFSLLFWLGEDRDVSITPLQIFDYLLSHRVRDLELNMRMPRTDTVEKVNQISWGDSAHDAKLKSCFLHISKAARLVGSCMGLLEYLIKVRLDHVPEFRQVSVAALPMKERSTELLLQQSDGTS